MAAAVVKRVCVVLQVGCAREVALNTTLVPGHVKSSGLKLDVGGQKERERQREQRAREREAKRL